MDVPNDLKHLTDEQIRDLGRFDTSSGVKTLDQEKFDTAQELVQLAGAIGRVRADLSYLKEAKSEFMLAREKEAIDRVLAVIERSQDALRQVDENHDKLHAIVADLTNLSDRITNLRDDVVTLIDDFRQKTEKFLERLDKTERKLTKQTEENEKERQRLEGVADVLADREQVVAKAEEAVKDARRTLTRGFDELNAKLGKEPNAS